MTVRADLEQCLQLAEVEKEKTWIKPVPLDRIGAAILPATDIYPVAGGMCHFSQIDVCSLNTNSNTVLIWRGRVSDWLTHTQQKQFAEETLHRLVSGRSGFAGLAMSCTQVMGIVNVTPDSFSDGGQFSNSINAVAHANQLVSEGASIIDVGGESTRPGATPISVKEEQERVIPVISNLSNNDILVSADTRHSDTMQKALQAGAQIINDVSGFRNSKSINLIANAHDNNSPPYVVIMHMQGEPGFMQHAPSYQFAPIEIYDYLEQQIAKLVAAGIDKSYIAVDVGFGFGKTISDNLALLDWMPLFHGLGVPILLGVSRKSTIAKLDNNASIDSRLGGSIALTMRALNAGVQMVRTHDVKQTIQAIKLWQAD